MRHGAVWVGCTAAALIVTTGCGAAAAKKTAEGVVNNTEKIMAVLSKAGDKTEKSGSAEVKMVTTMPQTGPVAMNGIYSWSKTLAFDVQMDTKAVGMSALQDTPTMRTLFVDGAYYYDIDPQPSGPVAGKEWLKVDGSAVFGEKGADAIANSGESSSPAAMVKSLSYASGVKKLGDQTVSGKATSHYRAVIDKNDMGRMNDGKDKSPLESATGADGKITMDVWVGKDDLPVRLVEKFGEVSVSVDFLKFGAAKEIQAPPASETGDITKLMKEQQATSGAGAGTQG